MPAGFQIPRHHRWIIRFCRGGHSMIRPHGITPQRRPGIARLPGVVNIHKNGIFRCGIPVYIGPDIVHPGGGKIKLIGSRASRIGGGAVGTYIRGPGPHGILNDPHLRINHHRAVRFVEYRIVLSHRCPQQHTMIRYIHHAISPSSQLQGPLTLAGNTIRSAGSCIACR
ncbi:MAG: hypothetical protein BWY71_02127 [Planctomycetes bacterium ADurb.Bin412]|nr:MAG: hypothetical protein BWY71_02127 [Planctomycetes bacterium ADurb.Bin412]